jgi:hypothetical protein
MFTTTVKPVEHHAVVQARGMSDRGNGDRFPNMVFLLVPRGREEAPSTPHDGLSVCLECDVTEIDLGRRLGWRRRAGRALPQCLDVFVSRQESDVHVTTLLEQALDNVGPGGRFVGVELHRAILFVYRDFFRGLARAVAETCGLG